MLTILLQYINIKDRVLSGDVESFSALRIVPQRMPKVALAVIVRYLLGG